MPGKPATERLTLRLNADMLAFIDRERGSLSRPAFVRAAIRAQAQNKTLRRAR